MKKALFITSALVVFSVIILQYNIHTINQSLNRRLENSIKLAETALAQAVWQLNDDHIDYFFNALLLENRIVYAHVRAFSDTREFSVTKARAGFENRSQSFFRESPRFISKSHDIVYKGKKAGTIHICISRDGIYTKLLSDSLPPILMMSAIICLLMYYCIRLRQSGKRYRDLFDNAVEGIFQSIPDGKYLSVNPAFARILGYDSPDDALASLTDIGRQLYVIPEDRRELLGILDENGRAEGFETRLYRKDGRVIWASVYARKVCGNRGETLYYEGSFVDITERKQAEEELRKLTEELRESEEKYRSIFENAVEGIFQSVPGGGFLSVNPAYAEIFGYDSSEEVLSSITDIAKQLYVNPEDREELIRIITEKGRVEGFETQMYRKDGSILWVSVYAHSVCNSQGMMYFEGSFTDITERKMIEQALRESEARFRTIIQESPFCMEVFTPDGILRIANRACESLFGVPPKIGVYNVFENPEVKRIGAIPHLEKVLAGEATHNFKNHYDAAAATGEETGRKRWLKSCFYPIKDAGGKVINFVIIHEDITDLKNHQEHLEDMVEKRTVELVAANAKLRERENRYRSVMNAAPDPVVVYDVNGQVEYLNPAFSQVFGWEFEELKGKRIDFVPEENMPETIDAIKRLYAGETLRSMESRRFDRDGNILQIQVSASTFNDPDGEPTGSVVILRDVTEKWELEQLLRESERKLYHIIDFLPDAVLVIDKEGTVIAWNRAMEKMTGVNAEAILGKGDYEYAIPFYGQRRRMLIDLTTVPDAEFEKKYPNFERRAGLLTAETFAPNLPGGEAYLLLTASALCDSAGNVTGAIEMVRDITDRKRAEDELRQTKEYLENVFENSADIIVMVNNKGRFVHWNKSAAETFGYRFEELEGKSVFDLYPDKTELEDMLARLRSAGFIRGHEIAMIKKDGTVVPIEASVSLLKDKNKKTIGSVAVVRDLSQIKKTLAQVREANEKIVSSLNYAKMIQRSLLANLDVVKTYLPNSLFIWEPRDIVGGDIFFTHSYGKGFIVAVIDCTGHGIPGAFMTMIAISSLNRIVKDEGCHNPAEILKRLNFIVKTTLQQDKEYTLSDDGMDAGIVRVAKKNIGSDSAAPQSSELTFSGAGIPLYYVLNGKAIFIKGDRQSIGYKRSNPDFNFTEHTIDIEKGMSFYMTSDGFTDQPGGKKRIPFGKKRLRKILKQFANESFALRRETLINALEEYRGEFERVDDVTVVGFGIKAEQ